MILCDTGIIVAAILVNDRHHQRALEARSHIHKPLVTTWPCITEAMYLLGRSGPPAQETLRRQIEADIFVFVAAMPEDAKPACTLMREYADAPMDFGDASLVVAAEAQGVNRILSLSQHFYAYRANHQTPFVVSP